MSNCAICGRPTYVEGEFFDLYGIGNKCICKETTPAFPEIGTSIRYTPKELKPYKCPVCVGTGLVSVPPGVAGDHGFTSTGTGPWECGACKGNQIIWG